MGRQHNPDKPCKRAAYFRARYLAKKAGRVFKGKPRCKCEGGKSWLHDGCVDAYREHIKYKKKVSDARRRGYLDMPLVRAEIMTDEQWRKAKKPASSVTWLELSAGASNS